MLGEPEVTCIALGVASLQDISTTCMNTVSKCLGECNDQLMEGAGRAIVHLID